MSNQTFAKTPAVFSFQRCMLVSDGAFFNQVDGNHADHPLPVVRHGLRGTINVNKPGVEREVAQVQTTETARTADDAEALVVVFGMRMLDLDHALFACAAQKAQESLAVRDSVRSFVERAKASKGLDEVARRIARRIANGSWLWRNRTSARGVRVQVLAGSKELASFDALSTPMHHFDDYSADEHAVAARLADGLRGNPDASLEVRAVLDFGVRGSVEVHPSEAYIADKPKRFARPLYKITSTRRPPDSDPTEGVRVMGQAALRDQKIANQLRTIDTWYGDFAVVRHPIPIEPNGASIQFMQFFRRDDRRTSAFDMFARLNTIDPTTADGMYCIGAMIRGGVFGEKGDDKAEGKAKSTDAASEE